MAERRGSSGLGRLAARHSRRAFSVALKHARTLKYRALSDCQDLRGRPKIIQPVLFTGEGTIEVGEGVTFGWWNSADFHTGYTYVEARRPEARIEIGDGVFFTNSISIVCEQTHITIGPGAIIGAHTYIVESDGHGSSADGMHMGMGTAGLAAPIKIGSNVAIGPRTIILKGAEIGDNSIIGAGSIVTSSIPELVFAAGAPARVITSFKDWDTGAAARERIGAPTPPAPDSRD